MMMRSLIASAFAAAIGLAGLGGTPAHAQGCGPQNPNCIVPTAPVGTNNNQAASTAFVLQNAAAALNGLCATAGAAAVYNGTAWQCSTGPASFVHVGIPNSIAEPGDFWIARPGAVSGTVLQMQDGKAGTLRTLTNGMTGVNFQSLVDTSASGFSYSAISLDTQCQAGTGGACVGLNIFSQSNTNWTASGALAGTSAINTIGQSTKGGTAWGSNFVGSCVTTACTGVYATELDVQNSVAGTAQASAIWLIAKNSVTPTAGSVALISSTVSNTGFPTAGLYFSTVAGFYPLTTGATVIKSDAATVTHGLDLSALTCSIDCITVPGFIAASGGITANQNAAAIPVSGNIPTNGVNLFSADGSNAGFTALSFGANPTNLFIRIDGTNASKSSLLSGDIIGQMSGRGWDGSGVISATQVAIQLSAAENWVDATHRGTIMLFKTTPPASAAIATAMEIFGSGGVGIGSTPSDVGAGGLFATDLYSGDATYLVRTKTTLTNSAAGNTATLTNAPAVGNPTKWLAIDDNGTSRKIPAW